MPIESQSLRSDGSSFSDNHQFCGTTENSKVWFNSSDSTGLIFAFVVWLNFAFTLGCVAYFIAEGYFGLTNGIIILVLMFFSVWSHMRTMFGDPGSVPAIAHPVCPERNGSISICGRCDSYKPPKSHHDRISNRCISRMDHFCPWTNNAIGANNQKQFFLFLIYTTLASAYIYVLIVIHLLYCDEIGCTEFSGTALILGRILIFVVLFGMLFTASMIINQSYGLSVGLGTIDRMKLKGDFLPDEDPIPFHHVFGDQWYTYWIPTDPVFNDREAVLHYKLGSEPYNPR